MLVLRNGEVLQSVPFDFLAQHVGRGAWGTLSSLSSLSIGVMLENSGRATGPNSDYPKVQIENLVRVLKVLKDTYPELKDVVGHKDVSPVRKIDPLDETFPMASVRFQVFGRKEALPPPAPRAHYSTRSNETDQVDFRSSPSGRGTSPYPWQRLFPRRHRSKPVWPIPFHH